MSTENIWLDKPVKPQEDDFKAMQESNFDVEAAKQKFNAHVTVIPEHHAIMTDRNCGNCASGEALALRNIDTKNKMLMKCFNCNEQLDNWQPKIMSAEPKREFNHYFKDVSKINELDVYRVVELFDVPAGAIDHAVKKLLCSGQRGAKDRLVDVQEAVKSLNRWLEMRREDEQ